jgi:hypothetical protein
VWQVTHPIVAWLLVDEILTGHDLILVEIGNRCLYLLVLCVSTLPGIRILAHGVAPIGEAQIRLAPDPIVIIDLNLIEKQFLLKGFPRQKYPLLMARNNSDNLCLWSIDIGNIVYESIKADSLLNVRGKGRQFFLYHDLSHVTLLLGEKKGRVCMTILSLIHSHLFTE